MDDLQAAGISTWETADLLTPPKRGGKNGVIRGRVMLDIRGQLRKCPWARIRHRIDVCPKLEAHYRGDLFYDPWDILHAHGFVYLLRFSEPIGRVWCDIATREVRYDPKAYARYYLGYADNFESFVARMYRHVSPHPDTSPSIILHCHRAGVTLTLVRLWFGFDRKLERALKERGRFKRHDPLVNPNWADIPTSEFLTRFRTHSLAEIAESKAVRDRVANLPF